MPVEEKDIKELFSKTEVIFNQILLKYNSGSVAVGVSDELVNKRIATIEKYIKEQRQALEQYESKKNRKKSFSAYQKAIFMRQNLLIDAIKGIAPQEASSIALNEEMLKFIQDDLVKAGLAVPAPLVNPSSVASTKAAMSTLASVKGQETQKKVRFSENEPPIPSGQNKKKHLVQDAIDAHKKELKLIAIRSQIGSLGIQFDRILDGNKKLVTDIEVDENSSLNGKMITIKSLLGKYNESQDSKREFPSLTPEDAKKDLDSLKMQVQEFEKQLRMKRRENFVSGLKNKAEDFLKPKKHGSRVGFPEKSRAWKAKFKAIVSNRKRPLPESLLSEKERRNGVLSDSQKDIKLVGPALGRFVKRATKVEGVLDGIDLSSLIDPLLKKQVESLRVELRALSVLGDPGNQRTRDDLVKLAKLEKDVDAIVWKTRKDFLKSFVQKKAAQPSVTPVPENCPKIKFSIEPKNAKPLLGDLRYLLFSKLDGFGEYAENLKIENRALMDAVKKAGKHVSKKIIVQDESKKDTTDKIFVLKRAFGDQKPLAKIYYATISTAYGDLSDVSIYLLGDTEKLCTTGKDQGLAEGLAALLKNYSHIQSLLKFEHFPEDSKTVHALRDARWHAIPDATKASALAAAAVKASDVSAANHGEAPLGSLKSDESMETPSEFGSSKLEDVAESVSNEDEFEAVPLSGPAQDPELQSVSSLDSAVSSKIDAINNITLSQKGESPIENALTKQYLDNLPRAPHPFFSDEAPLDPPSQLPLKPEEPLVASVVPDNTNKHDRPFEEIDLGAKEKSGNISILRSFRRTSAFLGRLPNRLPNVRNMLGTSQAGTAQKKRLEGNNANRVRASLVKRLGKAKQGIEEGLIRASDGAKDKLETVGKSLQKKPSIPHTKVSSGGMPQDDFSPFVFGSPPNQKTSDSPLGDENLETSNHFGKELQMVQEQLEASAGTQEALTTHIPDSDTEDALVEGGRIVDKAINSFKKRKSKIDVQPELSGMKPQQGSRVMPERVETKRSLLRDVNPFRTVGQWLNAPKRSDATPNPVGTSAEVQGPLAQQTSTPSMTQKRRGFGASLLGRFRAVSVGSHVDPDSDGIELAVIKTPEKDVRAKIKNPKKPYKSDLAPIQEETAIDMQGEERQAFLHAVEVEQKQWTAIQNNDNFSKLTFEEKNTVWSLVAAVHKSCAIFKTQPDLNLDDGLQALEKLKADRQTLVGSIKQWETQGFSRELDRLARDFAKNSPMLDDDKPGTGYFELADLKDDTGSDKGSNLSERFSNVRGFFSKIATSVSPEENASKSQVVLPLSFTTNTTKNGLAAQSDVAVEELEDWKNPFSKTMTLRAKTAPAAFNDLLKATEKSIARANAVTDQLAVTNKKTTKKPSASDKKKERASALEIAIHENLVMNPVSPSQYHIEKKGEVVMTVTKHKKANPHDQDSLSIALKTITPDDQMFNKSLHDMHLAKRKDRDKSVWIGGCNANLPLALRFYIGFIEKGLKPQLPEETKALIKSDRKLNEIYEKLSNPETIKSYKQCIAEVKKAKSMIPALTKIEQQKRVKMINPLIRKQNQFFSDDKEKLKNHVPDTHIKYTP